MDLSFRQLAVLRELMTSDTATSVARKLNLSQPGVSKLLRQTEEQLGLRLFERIKGRLYPTPEATLLMAELEKVMGAAEAFDRLAGDLRDTVAGRISIAALPTLANVFLPSVVTEFQRRHPTVRIAVDVLPSLRIVDQVNDGHVDIGLLGDSTEMPTNKSEDLFECASVCIMRPDHPLAERSHVELEDMLQHVIVSYFIKSPYGERIAKTFSEAGLDYNPQIEAGASTTICAMVESGAGIAIVEPYLLYNHTSPNVVARPVRPVIPIRPRLIYPRFRPLTMTARRFVSMFKQAMEEKARDCGP
ncbi:LysR family transcriptional regulator [Paralimibaculum aggregatum]|uniref:LysR family transcriptional regulator n=1 Tax=Paralimibaculum aggregatum TaxID=3036245 RepID=A0ABQ6LGP3_9RHOB|nr:LysR family transcriptional regulator [Limibaculum sp. NKW23]